jgi:hypothetical protein
MEALVEIKEKLSLPLITLDTGQIKLAILAVEISA